MAPSRPALVRRFRVVLLAFIAGLLLSGLTVFPLQRELEIAAAMRGVERIEQARNSFDRWIVVVRDGLREAYAKHPWLGYGTDWLAFAHPAIAGVFIGPYVDPVRNKWVLQAGLVLCVAVVPLALIAGEVRGIPWGWRLIDCSFGIVGALPLSYCLWVERELETSEHEWEAAE